MRPNRRGFTLIELVIVVAIIATLVGILSPALFSVISNTRVANAMMDIRQLESGVSAFKAEYNTPMPSQVYLYESYTDSSNSYGWVHDSAARATIKRIWGRFDFRKNRDFNGDGDYDDWYILKGDQCLVFFLGGMYDPVRGGFNGFSDDPRDPFNTTAATSQPSIYKFELDRVKNSIPGVPYQYFDNNVLSGDCLEFFPVYLDPLPGQTKPYIFASAEVNDGFYNDMGLGADSVTSATVMENPMGFHLYRRNDDSVTDPKYWNPGSIQIISPGWDGLYGTGGAFFSKARVQLPPAGTRTAEHDNLTNFRGGMLVP